MLERGWCWMSKAPDFHRRWSKGPDLHRGDNAAGVPGSREGAEGGETRGDSNVGNYGIPGAAEFRPFPAREASAL